MKRAATITLLTMAVLVLALSVAKLRRSEHGPPSVNLTAQEATDAKPANPQGRVSQQPTILRAKPADADNGNWSSSSPRLWESSVRKPVTPLPVAEGLYSSSDSPFQFDSSTSETFPKLPVNNVAPQWNPAVDQVDHDTDSDASRPATGEVGETTKPRSPPPQNASILPPTRVLTDENDSLWRISERVYGNGGYFKALYELNRLRMTRPDRLGAGIEILTPPESELQQLFPASCPQAIE